MTEKEHNDKGEPIFLDGSPLCPRQNLEGRKTDDTLWNEMKSEDLSRYKNDPLSKYLTYSEYSEYIQPIYNWYPSNIRVRMLERHGELYEKIDPEAVLAEWDSRLQKQREARASARVVNRYELGAREFTFTYSPKWFGDAEARLQMSSAIQKLVKYYKDEIIQMRAVGEVGSAGLSHIHCFYKLKNGKKITDKNFQRAYKMWDTKKKTGPSGHQGGHHQTVKNESDFSGYIDKDIENAWFEVNIENSLDPQ